MCNLLLRSLPAGCEVDYLIKNRKAEGFLMLSPGRGQKGMKVCLLPVSPVTPNPSQGQLESRLFRASRHIILHKLKIPYPIWAERVHRDKIKAQHGFARSMATTSGWTLVQCDCRNQKHQVRQRRVRRMLQPQSHLVHRGCYVQGSTRVSVLHDTSDCIDPGQVH